MGRLLFAKITLDGRHEEVDKGSYHQEIKAF
jgi:hypothetical protein